MMECSRSFYQWIRTLDDAEVRDDVCMCSRRFCSSLWICQSVQSLVMLSSVMYIRTARFPLSGSSGDFEGSSRQSTLFSSFNNCFCPLASLYIFRDIVNGVEYRHSKDIVQHALKPGNVFFNVDTRCQIATRFTST
jgi:serine/threonine protein kinase